MFGTLVVVAILSMSQPMSSSQPSTEDPRIPHAVPGEFTEAVMPLSQAMQTRVDELFSGEEIRQGSVRAITRGVEALGVDWGDPSVNFDYQDKVIGLMLVALEVAPKEEREAAREALRAGVLSFHKSGGYREVDVPQSVRAAMKIARMNLAECLVLAAREDDAEVRSVLQEVVGRMESDATAFAPEALAKFATERGVSAVELADRMAGTDQRLIERFQAVIGLATPPEHLAAMVETLTGDKRAAIEAVRLRAVDDEFRQAAPWLIEGGHDSGGGLAAAFVDPCLLEYRRAPAAALKKARILGKYLHDLARRGSGEPARIGKTTKAVLNGVGNDCLDESLLATLLLTYRSLLSRPGATDRVVEAIDRGLQRSGAQLVESASVRVLWARAVGALRSRASEACKDLVRSQLEKENNEEVRNALEKVRSDLNSFRQP